MKTDSEIRNFKSKTGISKVGACVNSKACSFSKTRIFVDKIFASGNIRQCITAGNNILFIKSTYRS